jgi:hypothetical protein
MMRPMVKRKKMPAMMVLALSNQSAQQTLTGFIVS